MQIFADNDICGHLFLGYPEHLVMTEFNQRFDVLSKPVGGKASSIFDMMDNKGRAEKILQHVDLDSSQYRIGISVVRILLII